MIFAKECSYYRNTPFVYYYNISDCEIIVSSHELEQNKQKCGSLRSRDAPFLFI